LSVFILLFTIVILAVIIEVAAIALKVTGLAMEQARFQALSAITSTGFTTSEAELIVNHPVRRRISMWLMVFGYVGLAFIITSLVGFFGNQPPPSHYIIAAILAVVVYRLGTDRWLIGLIDRHIEARLVQSIERQPISEVLRLGQDYRVAEMCLQDTEGITGTTLGEIKLRERGIMVLAIKRGTDIVHAPHGRHSLRAGDVLVVYGHKAAIDELQDIAGGLACDI